MFKGIKGLLALLAMATCAWAQGNVWDGVSFDTTWYTNNKSATQFTITTPAQLAGLARLVNGVSGNGTYNMNGKTITLGNDIMLNDITDWQDWDATAPANTWTAIGTSSRYFGGTFDGAGHKVGGVYIKTETNAADNYQGLFAYVSSGTIKNLGAIASYVKGAQRVGGLVGYNGGTITNSYAAGNVTGTGNNVGGLVGYNMGTVTNSYAAGTVTGTGSDVGGLVGYHASGTITNSYYDKETSGQSNNRGTGLATSEMKSQRFANKLNIAIIANNLSEMNKWVWTAGNYPALSNEISSETIDDCFASGDGTQNNPYIIQTPEQLGNFSDFVNFGKTFEEEYVKLGADIALNDTTNWQNWETAAPANTWTAIGTSSSINFIGTFDGAGHVVSGVYINRTGTATADNYQGLFGYVGSGGTIENLGVVASYVKANQYVGGLAGYNNGGTITNSYAAGTVSGTSNQVGGLAGYNNGGTISNSYATGDVNGGSQIGGLAGLNGSGSTITSSYAAGTVSGTGDVGGLAGGNLGTISNSYATGDVTGTGTGGNSGGLVGSNGSFSNKSGTIANSYAAGNVTGYNGGGLAGQNYDTISNSYATGNVTGSYQGGGLVQLNGGTITNSYATGKATGTSYAGGLFVSSYSGHTVTNSYYDKETSGRSTDIGNKTTAEMKTQATYTDWDFDDIWAIDGNVNGGYPFLRVIFVPVTVTNGTGSSYYAWGTTVTIIADDPPEGEQFKKWDITPAVTFTAGSATDPEAEFTMPAEAVTATAVYEPIPPTNHLITVHEEGGGIANANEHSAPQGAQITLTATPDEGKRFVQWQVVSGGITLSSATTATATFTMPDNPVAVRAVFEEIPSPILLPQLASGNRAVQMRNGLSLTATSNATVEIYGLSGNLVSRQSFASGVYAISFGHLPKGVYLVKVSFGNGKEVLRVPVR
jgi:hypothetical protein